MYQFIESWNFDIDCQLSSTSKSRASGLTQAASISFLPNLVDRQVVDYLPTSNWSINQPEFLLPASIKSATFFEKCGSLCSQILICENMQIGFEDHIIPNLLFDFI